MGDNDERNLMRSAAILLWSSSLLQLKFLSTNIVQKIGSDNGNYRRQSVPMSFARDRGTDHASRCPLLG
jgi:hypothetical protein